MNKLLLYLAGLLLASAAMAGEKDLMHCFAFTAVEGATQASWDAFYKATDELPKKIKGITHVWYGKLQRPLKVGEATRQYGVCMEMGNEQTLKDYDSDPAHAAWVEAYSRVRVEGTTTFNILGQ
jgi:Stress responsive A/B Barrel Domain